MKSFSFQFDWAFEDVEHFKSLDPRLRRSEWIRMLLVVALFGYGCWLLFWGGFGLAVGVFGFAGILARRDLMFRTFIKLAFARRKYTFIVSLDEVEVRLQALDHGEPAGQPRTISWSAFTPNGKVTENAYLFHLDTGQFGVFIPKRAIPEDEEPELREFLQQKMGDRYYFIAPSQSSGSRSDSVVG